MLPWLGRLAQWAAGLAADAALAAHIVAGRRSWKWPAVQRQVLARDGHRCRACGRTAGQVRVVAHHIEPVHERPELELVPANALALCDPPLARKSGCHWRHGHTRHDGKAGWQYWNPDVVADAAAALEAGS